jgi:adenylylsulfate kinase-like enzyme
MMEGIFVAAYASYLGLIFYRDKSEVFNDIVQHLTHSIEEKLFSVATHPVGIEARMQDVIQLLSNKQTEKTIIIGIWGINGVGKTTIAKATYNQIGCSFEDKSFLLNVNEIWEQSNGQVSLRQQLLSDIYKTTNIQINTIESGKMVLRERLRRKKIFLVLDNVNKLEQLNALCGSREWFGHGSRIIITTSDKHILSSLHVDHVYRMKYMDTTESLELFSWHAFKIPSPIESYADLSRDVVEYCGGLPIALEEFGCFLFKRSVAEWKSAVTSGIDIIMEKLRTNFYHLDGDVKGVFLDIATSFIGMDKDDVIEILNYSARFPENGIRVLEEKSLVTIDSKNRIGMHTLLRAMGREIIRKQQAMGSAEVSYGLSST